MADGLGLASAYGAGAGADELARIMQQRLLARQFIETVRAHQADEANRQKALDEQAAGRQAVAAENARTHQANEGIREGTEAQHLADTIPDQSFLAEGDPAAALLQKRGYGSLLTKQPAQESVGQEFVGPLQDTQTRGAGHPAGFLKTASAKQQSDASNQERKDWQASIQQQMADLKAGQSPPSSYQLQPEIDPKTGQQTGRFLGYNTKLNRWEPVQGNGPGATKPAPGAAQGAEHERSKHEALGSLDQLDQAIDAAAPFLGPGQGRVSSIQELIGNPDPKISALGTKLLLTKMQVDHAATGTVRAGASPQLLARWDNLLSRNLEPQNLKASVQAMREILGGQAPASSPKPTAADLIKKYGG